MKHIVSARRRCRQRGFTIIELLVAMLVFGVLMFMAVPSFQSAMDGNAIRSTTTDLVQSLNMARSQAVNLRRDDVKLEARDGDWANGWTLVFPAGTQEEDQSFRPHARASVSLASGSVGVINFSRLGIAAPEAEFLVCLGGSGEVGRKVSVSRFGKVTNEHYTCD